MFPKWRINILFYFIIAFNCAFGVVKITKRIESLDSCGGEYSGYQYTIVSPNYPNNYYDNEDCTYILHGSPHAKCNQTFHLTFLNFTLRFSNDCRDDFLEIGDRSVFCGNIVGIRNYSSENNILKLRFHSDNKDNDKGFKILVTTLPCPNIISSLNQRDINNWHTNIHNYQRETISELSKSIVNKDSEYINYKNIHPVYQPNINNNIKSNNNKILNNTKLSSNEEQKNLPIYDAKLFRNKTSSSKISTYLFASPDSENHSDSHLKTWKNNVEIIVSPPSKNFLLPFNQRTIFNNNISKQFVNESKTVENNLSNFNNFSNGISRNNEKLLLPRRPNNIPPGVPYAPIPGYETQIKTGEVLDNIGGYNDCNGKTNIDSAVQVFENTRDVRVPGNNYLPSVFSPRPNIYPATVYGTPDNNYPSVNPSIPNIPVEPDIIVDSEFIYPNQNNPNPSDQFIPSQNPGNIFPEITSNSYSPSNRQCCNNNYGAPRFLLSSPGFPSLFYSSNVYKCIYTIIPSSINTCRIRLNFKYFNYGTNDEFCSNGYVEIDGRRYCGCKTGLTIITNIINSIPKLIGVNYSGYPRTRFNGFLIEVIQELCSNYNLSRKKKAVNDTLIDNLKETNVSSNNRRKRQLGYTYPIPSIPFNSGSGQFPNPGRLIPLDSPAQSRCQTLNLADWTLAAKEVHFRGARCFISNGNGGLIPSSPGFTPGYLLPSGPGIGFPNYSPPSSNPDVIFHGTPVPQPPIYQRPRDSPSPVGNCQLISVAEGIISSSRYPNFYSNNLNSCYRFLRTPNGCRLSMSILDFDLENSPGCIKDYLLFSNQNSRYCGRSLAGTKTILEFPRNNIIDIQFATDSYGTGRGFNIGFVQVQCKVI